MAMATAKNGHMQYNHLSYMIRPKMFKSYKSGTANVKTLYTNNLWKIKNAPHCWYCGKTVDEVGKLTVNQVFPQAKGGLDDTENVIMCCQSCNSSKGKKDLMEWYYEKGLFPSPAVVSTYLKLVLKYCNAHGLMEQSLEEVRAMNLPFNPFHLPMQFPHPGEWGCMDESESHV